MKTRSNKEALGAWLAVISGLMYGLLGVFGVALMREGLSVPNLSFWRFFVSVLFLAIIIFFIKTKIENKKELFMTFAVGALFYSPCGMLFYWASKLIPTGQAMVIFFIYPIFVMLLGRIFDKQKLSISYIFSLITTLAGLVLLIDLNNLNLDLLGISYCLLSALFYGFYVYLTKRSSLNPILSTTSVSLGCALSALLVAIFDNSLFLPVTFSAWANILGLGIICSALPILLLLISLKYISANKASILSVLEPVFTVLFGVVILDETIDIKSALGITLILGAAIGVMLRRT